MKRFRVQEKSEDLHRGSCASRSAGLELSLSQIPFASLMSPLGCADQDRSVANPVSYSPHFDWAALTRNTGDEWLDYKPGAVVSIRIRVVVGSAFFQSPLYPVNDCNSFSQIAPPFPQKLNFRYAHNTSAQNRRNSHSTHFPRCGVGGGIRSSDSIFRICSIA